MDNESSNFKKFNGSNDSNYGISKSGIKKLKNDLDNDLNRLSRSLSKTSSSSELGTLIKLIQNNWHGEDADQFVQNLIASSEDLREILDVMKTKIDTALDQYQTDFLAFQNKNAGSVSKVSIK